MEATRGFPWVSTLAHTHCVNIQFFPRRTVIAQLRFLLRVAECIPVLLATVQQGHVEASQRLGRRRLADGREVELWLVARAPRPDRGPLVRGRE